MDELAATGVRFTQAYYHTVCCPARAMLMTGRYPQRSGANNWPQNWATGTTKSVMGREEITLAEAPRDAGYKTALFGKWHLGADLEHEPTEQGFDAFFGFRGGFIDKSGQPAEGPIKATVDRDFNWIRPRKCCRLS